MHTQRTIKSRYLVGLCAILLALAPVSVVLPQTTPHVAYAAPAGCSVTGEAYGAQAVAAAPLLILPKVADSVLPPGGTQTVATISAGAVLGTGLVTDTTTDASTSTQASSVSTATVTTVRLLGRVITADVIRSVATSTSNGATAASTAAGTNFTNLMINGVLYANVAANARVDLAGIGYVILNEQLPSGNGTTSSGLTVNALHLYVTAAGLLPVGAEVIVGSATSGVACSGAAAGATGTAAAGATNTAAAGATNTAAAGATNTAAAGATNTAAAGATATMAPAGCSVTGEAYGAQAVAAAPLLILPKVADSVLPPGGTQTVATISAGAVLGTGLVTDTTTDASTSTQASSVSTATVTTVRLLGRVITADVIRSVATSTSNGATAASTAAGTNFTNLMINGVLYANVAANARVDLAGIGYVILNEQLPSGNGTTSSGLTVNALHLYVTAAGLLPVGAEVIVGSATSGVACSGAAAGATGTAAAGATNTAAAGATGTAVAGATSTATAIAGATGTAATGATATMSAGATNTAMAGATNTAMAGATNTAMAGATNTAVAGATNTSIPPAAAATATAPAVPPAATATAPAVPPAATATALVTEITLTPLLTTRYAGIPEILTVAVTRNGTPVAGLRVTCQVIRGPDAGLTVQGTTDADGQAPCLLIGHKVGLDLVVASVSTATGTLYSTVAQVRWAAAGPPCSVQVDLLTGPVLTHNPVYHGRLIDGVLGHGPCAPVAALRGASTTGRPLAPARPLAAAPSPCTQGWAAVSSYDYVITDPLGHVTRTPRLVGQVQPGDTIQASFTIKPRPRACATVQVSLASYAAPAGVINTRTLRQQVLYRSATGSFGAGVHDVALRVDVPASPLAVPAPIRPHIAQVLVRGTLVFRDHTQLSVAAWVVLPASGRPRGTLLLASPHVRRRGLVTITLTGARVDAHAVTLTGWQRLGRGAHAQEGRPVVLLLARSGGGGRGSAARQPPPLRAVLRLGLSTHRGLLDGQLVLRA